MRKKRKYQPGVGVTGTLHAHESATLSAQVMGRVQQVLVREGHTVKAGQTLVVLDDATLCSSSDQADASVTAMEQQQAAAQTNADLATVRWHATSNWSHRRVSAPRRWTRSLAVLKPPRSK